jgi:hypothetical protein
MRRRFLLLGLACAIVFTLAGCATTKYYKVTDPISGRVYYTDNVQRKGDGGAVRFKDAVSRTEVTLSASEVMEITQDQFKANVHGR